MNLKMDLILLSGYFCGLAEHQPQVNSSLLNHCSEEEGVLSSKDFARRAQP
jgi:hypothetical protein